MDELKTEWVTFMKNLYTLYPDFVGRKLFLTGESYGGKYLPAFSVAILEANEKKTYNVTFNLTATLVGDPYTAPLTQRTWTYKIPQALNILDDYNMP